VVAFSYHVVWSGTQAAASSLDFQILAPCLIFHRKPDFGDVVGGR